LTVERATRSNNLSSASGSVKLSVAETLVRAGTVVADRSAVGDAAYTLVVVSALASLVCRTGVNVATGSHSLTRLARCGLGEIMRVTKQVGVVRATTRRSLSQRRCGRQKREREGGDEGEARHG